MLQQWKMKRLRSLGFRWEGEDRVLSSWDRRQDNSRADSSRWTLSISCGRSSFVDRCSFRQIILVIPFALGGIQVGPYCLDLKAIFRNGFVILSNAYTETHRQRYALWKVQVDKSLQSNSAEYNGLPEIQN